MAMAFYVTLHERESSISYGAIDQHISDEWIRRQMKLIRETDHDYPEGLVDTFRRAEESLLLGSGLSFKSLLDQVEFVYKKGPLHQPSLMASLSNVSDERLAEEIRLTRRDERFRGSYTHNLAFRTGRLDDEAELYWQNMRKATYTCNTNQDQSREQGRNLLRLLCILQKTQPPLPVPKGLWRKPEWINRHTNQMSRNNQSLYQSQMESQLKPV
jgi:hypothetical protein